MTLPTHAAAGLIIGAITGHPAVGVLAACAPDIDHLYSYFKNGYLSDWKTFYANAFGREDAKGDQRNILHNVILGAIVCTSLFYAIDHGVALTITLAYASHILFDALDTSDYFPLYPWKKINIRGFVDFYSASEGVFFLALAITSVIIILR